MKGRTACQFHSITTSPFQLLLSLDLDWLPHSLLATVAHRASFLYTLPFFMCTQWEKELSACESNLTGTVDEKVLLFFLFFFMLLRWRYKNRVSFRQSLCIHIVSKVLPRWALLPATLDWSFASSASFSIPFTRDDGASVLGAPVTYWFVCNVARFLFADK